MTEQGKRPSAGPGDDAARNSPSILRRSETSEADLRAHSSLQPVHPTPLEHVDYSRVVVRKPWGYEYLVFENESVAIWILYLHANHQTSLHCHPRKTTSVTVLSGEVLSSTLDEEVRRTAAEGVWLAAGVFHRTRALNPEGAFVMEIETPVDKQDLLRLEDDYGRQGLGYESSDHFSFQLQNYNYTSLIDSNVYYNVKKWFGHCSVELHSLQDTDALHQLLSKGSWDVLHLLKGCIRDAAGNPHVVPGQSISHDEVHALPSVLVADTVEMLLVTRQDPLVRLAEYLVRQLKSSDLRDFFYVPGTTNAHLLDAVGRDTQLRSLALQTEQAATLAAEAYAKVSGYPAVVVLSSGASCINALVGVTDCWIDSTPMLVVSGQSRPSSLGVPGTDLRQLANKEVDIVGMVAGVTRQARVLANPQDVRAVLEEAIAVSRHGRPGPVWLDIPIDVLGARIDESSLAPWSNTRVPDEAEGALARSVQQVIHLLESAQRPVLLAGHGIRVAGVDSLFRDIAGRLQIPVLTSRLGADLVDDAFPLYFGRPGTYGHRSANFVVQNADVLLSVGARLSLPLVGRNFQAFARAATTVVVDIDPGETSKVTVACDLPIVADAGDFLRMLNAKLPSAISFARPPWIERCERWRSEFPPARDWAASSSGPGANAYAVVDALSDAMAPDDILVVDGGASLDYVMQAFRLKSGQRIISSPGLEHQGFALPGAIGACLAARGRRIVCLCEKKGLQLSLSELQTIVSLGLPVKLLVLNTRTTDTHLTQVQATYFGGRHVGTPPQGIVGTLDIVALGKAYGIVTDIIDVEESTGATLERLLNTEGPILCSIPVPETQQTLPRLSFKVTPDGRWLSRPLEDMTPLLKRDELKSNMLIELWDEDEK